MCFVEHFNEHNYKKKMNIQIISLPHHFAVNLHAGHIWLTQRKNDSKHSDADGNRQILSVSHFNRHTMNIGIQQAYSIGGPQAKSGSEKKPPSGPASTYKYDI